MRRCALAVWPLAALLAAPGCGGGASTDRYADDAEEICDRASARVRALGPEPRS